MSLRRMLALGLPLSAPVLLAATLPSVEPMPTLDAATLAPAAMIADAGERFWPMTLQERAYTSPIWYTPGKRSDSIKGINP